MLMVLLASPPVPQVSTSSERSASVRSGGGCGDGAHGVDEAGELGGGFAAGRQRAEESGDLELGSFTLQDGLEEVAGLGPVERLLVFEDGSQMRGKGQMRHDGLRGLPVRWVARSDNA
jgi:hypothetical protein